MAKMAMNGGEQHREQTVLYVSLNLSSEHEKEWILSSIRNVLNDSIPNAEVVLIQAESPKETEDFFSLVRDRAIKAMKISHIKPLKFGVGIEIATVHTLRRAYVVIVADEDATREGIASSVAVPPNFFQPEDFEHAFHRAWKQILNH